MRRGVSIHIGLNRLYEDHYKLNGVLQFKQLEGCVEDAILMQKIAKSQGFETEKFVTDLKTKPEQLKSCIILDRIRYHAAQLRKGDIFLITYAGHGSQINNFGNDFEIEGNDQIWCLYDRMIIDDELAQLWSLFDSGVRILFISDSCHSGSQFYKSFMETTVLSRTEFGNTSKSLILNKALYDEFEWNNDDDKSRKIRTGAAGYIIREHQEIYGPVFQELSRKLPSHAESFNELVEASLIAISACKDDENARDGTNNGVFTAALKKVWFGTDTPVLGQEGVFQGNYLNFFEAVRQATNDANNAQNPNFFPFTIDEELENFPLIDRNDVKRFISSNPFEI